MAEARTYQQFCPVARSLDVLGDRWTLLILRDLVLLGPRRFSDLRNNLQGIPPNLLSDRLRFLTAEGMVELEELPPPAARTVYALTERGREVVPVLRALSKFGVPLLDVPDDETVVSPHMAVSSLVLAFYDAGAAEGIDEAYQLDVDGLTQTLRSRRGATANPTTANPTTANPTTAPALRITTDARTLLALRQGATTLRAALADGRFVADGPKAALRRFAAVFALPY